MRCSIERPHAGRGGVPGGVAALAGAEREIHWDHFRRRLELLPRCRFRRLSSRPTSRRQAGVDDFGRAAASLGEAADLASTSGVRLALEFQKSSAFCASLETALALVAQSGAANVGVCLDVFHYYTGPSKFEDLAYLTRETWPGFRSAT